MSDTPSRKASEQLMQRYYRAAKSIRQLNVILLQNLHARLFPAEIKVQPIDADFQAVHRLLCESGLAPTDSRRRLSPHSPS